MGRVSDASAGRERMSTGSDGRTWQSLAPRGVGPYSMHRRIRGAHIVDLVAYLWKCVPIESASRRTLTHETEITVSATVVKFNADKAYELFDAKCKKDGFSATATGQAVFAAERIESKKDAAKATLDADYLTWCKYVARRTRPAGTLPTAGNPAAEYAASLAPFLADVVASGEDEANARRIVHRWIVSGLLAFRFGNKSRREITRVYGLKSAEIKHAFTSGEWPSEAPRAARPAATPKAPKGGESGEAKAPNVKVIETANAKTRETVDGMTTANATALLAVVVASLAARTLTSDESAEIDAIVSALAVATEDAQAA